MEGLSINSLLQIESTFNSEIAQIKKEIADKEKELAEAKLLNDSKVTRNNDTKRTVKTLRTKIIDAQNSVNEKIRVQESIMADRIFDRILNVDSRKHCGYLPDECVEEIKKLYLLLSRQGRLNVYWFRVVSFVAKLR
jgi:hypothetical protein